VPQAQEREVANYLKAMRWIEKNARSKLDEKSVLYLHRALMNGLLPDQKTGKYKGKQNYIVNEKGIRVFTPPSPKQTPGLIKDLLAWLNSKEAKDLHCVLLCAVFHHRLVSIHPFSDGNGRLARALGTMILYRRGFDTRHIFSLDDFFAGDRKRYYQKIQQARELQVSSIAKITLSARQEEILRILRDNSPISGAELIKNIKITRARLNQILSPLIHSGLVIKEGRSRATRYKLPAMPR
jgi:Fic family protein